jgi:hypothetical protein
VIQSGSGWLIKSGPGLAFSDGFNPGGDMIGDPRTVRAHTFIPAATYASNARVVLGSVFVPARYAVAGTVLEFIGNLRISNNSGNVPDGTLFGIVTDVRKLLAGNTFGSIYGAAVPDGDNVIFPNMIFQTELIADGADVALGDSPITAIFKPLIHGGSGNVTVASSSMTFEELSFGDELSTTPADEGFYIYFVMDIPASATPSVGINVVIDFAVTAQ